MESLKRIEPVLPELSNDRLTDNWMPLIAIGERCGFGDRVRGLAEHWDKLEYEDENLGILLLGDMLEIFEQQYADNIPTKIFLKELLQFEDRTWNEYGRMEKPITDKQLSKLLKPFEIKPQTVTISEKYRREFSRRSLKGYRKQDIQAVFELYGCKENCADSPESNVTRRQENKSNQISAAYKQKSGDGEATCDGSQASPVTHPSQDNLLNNIIKSEKATVRRQDSVTVGINSRETSGDGDCEIAPPQGLPLSDDLKAQLQELNQEGDKG